MKNLLNLLLIVLVSLTMPAVTLHAAPALSAWVNFTIDTPPGAVYALHQSPSGAAWVGSNQGFYAFDGFHAYPIPDASGHSFSAQVYAIVEEDDGRLWLGTNNGLFIYTPGERIIRPVDGDFPTEIRTMIADKSGRIWIGSLNGLYVYEPRTGNLVNYSDRLPHRAVYTLMDSETDGRIYIGTYDGLCRYDPQLGTFENVALHGARSSEGNVFVNALAERISQGLIYIGTEGALLRYYPESGRLEHITALDGNSIKALACDSHGLAAGTDNGLYVINDKGETRCFRHDSRHPSSIADNVVWTLLIDNKDNLWAGTGAGLSISGPDSAVQEIALADITGTGGGQTVYSIFRDSGRRLWLGGSNGLILAPEGLSAEASPEEVRWYEPSSERYPLPHTRVRAIAESSDGKLWVAGDGGLNLLDEDKGQFRRLRIVDHSHRHNANWAYALAEDSTQGKMWVGGYLGGIFSLDIDSLESGRNTAHADTALTSEDGSLANNLISNIVRDSQGGIWGLLFREGSVVRIDPNKNCEIRRIDIRGLTGGWPSLITPDPDGGVWVGYDGGGVVRIDAAGQPVGAPVPVGRPHHPSGILYAIAPVGREIWLATGDGVYALDRDSHHTRLLPLPPKTYSSIYFDELTRKVILGTTDAIVLADPRRIASAGKGHGINIARVTADGKAIDLESDELELPAGTGAVTLELATYDFTPNSFERFAWRASTDSAWTLLPPGENALVLSGLPTGTHSLEIRAGDEEAPVKTLDIRILPPWYLSTGFKLLWVAIALGAVLAIFLLMRRRNIANLRRLERRNALEKAEERLNFLTNISHDLKTPLSLIIAPLSRVRTGEHPTAETLEAISTAYDNALRLNRLLSHTLEASRLDAATDSAAVMRPTDVTALVRGLVDNCASAYPTCRFSFHAPEGEAVIADVDTAKFESIVSNLLSNAIKYSPQGNADISLDLAVDNAKGCFRLSVSDKGIGIMPDQIPLIFNRSYRTPRGSDISEGTGIGLYLVKHFVELHGGTVDVESTVGEDSTFTVEMPLKASSGVVEPKRRTATAAPVPDSSRRRILVVDDNEDVLTFIGTLLEPEFQCAFASSGSEGLDIAGSFRPDLIITDEKMPGMTGLEMARKLKSTPATASISIILLTAMGSNELESRSISTGIDLFMTKPFDPAMLKARVESILRRKAEIKRAARIEEITAAKPVELESESERTLAKVTETVERNIASPQLSVNFVCEQTGLQPKQLYRLMKKYVNQTPVEYIRSVRLDKAAALLEKGDLNVSEVMYRVGFSSPSYFSKCFHARFGKRPADFRK